MARCQACDAEILWGGTEAGKAMPIDATPVTNGKWTYIGGRVRFATIDDARLMRPLYTAHWSTCTDAARFRRRTP